LRSMAMTAKKLPRSAASIISVGLNPSPYEMDPRKNMGMHVLSPNIRNDHVLRPYVLSLIFTGSSAVFST